jgi:DinB superfamily
MDRPLLDRLASVPDRLAVATAGAAPAPPGEWSPSDIVRHLIAVEEEVWHVRIRQLTSEEHPTWRWAEPDRWLGRPDATLDELLERYREERTATLGLLAALDDSGWERAGTHVTYGVLNVSGLLSKALDHDEEHLASLSR